MQLTIRTLEFVTSCLKVTHFFALTVCELMKRTGQMKYLCPHHAAWRQISGSTLGEVMACCLATPHVPMFTNY